MTFFCTDGGVIYATTQDFCLDFSDDTGELFLKGKMDNILDRRA